MQKANEIARALDLDALRFQYKSATPFPFVSIENFLKPDFVAEVAASYPSFENASAYGVTFKTVNERKKVQVTNSTLFPEPIARLNDFLASQEFLNDVSYVTGIPNLLADPELDGGGMHITGPGGRLDVHIDFNYLENRKLHRRLNILVYLNPLWKPEWGGAIQLWDKEVKHCIQSFSPELNRCVIFETSEISYHGVTPVTTDASVPRKSFAAYYYTLEPPAHWTGKVHSTIFKARPKERVRGFVLMPVERIKHRLRAEIHNLKGSLQKLIKPSK